jgi:hypothetical protein
VQKVVDGGGADLFGLIRGRDTWTVRGGTVHAGDAPDA